jgi:hypothetical protein
MITLTAPRPLGSATRWRVDRVLPNEEAEEALAIVQLLTPGLMLITDRFVTIRNGASIGVAIDPSPARFSDALVNTSVSTPSGYTDAVNAWRTGDTPAARRAALETWMLSAGVAGANMAGT